MWTTVFSFYLFFSIVAFIYLTSFISARTFEGQSPFPFSLLYRSVPQPFLFTLRYFSFLSVCVYKLTYYS